MWDTFVFFFALVIWHEWLLMSLLGLLEDMGVMYWNQHLLHSYIHIFLGVFYIVHVQRGMKLITDY